MNCKFALILIICTLLVILALKHWPAPAEVHEKTVSIPVKKTFPGINSKTCDEYCSPLIIAELYHHWNEETESLEDPPFSPILYWKDKAKKPISYLESTEPPYGWICTEDDNNWCRNLEWYMTHCHLSKAPKVSSFAMYTDGAQNIIFLGWQRLSCEESMGPDAIVLEDNLPFLQGRVKGTVAMVNNVTRILFPDPVGASCWYLHCDRDQDESYQDCLHDAQLDIVEVPLETFVQIKDVACE